MLNIPVRVSAMVVLFAVLVANPTSSSQTYSLEAYETKASDTIGVKKTVQSIDVDIKASSDNRAARLQKFLESRGSPMAGSAKNFIEVADKYGLDWKMLPAIAGVESTFGQFVPIGSYNAYGWHNGKYYFSTWTHATSQVGKGIKEKWGYMGKVTPWKIGPYYAANPAWASEVTFYMKQIEQYN